MSENIKAAHTHYRGDLLPIVGMHLLVEIVRLPLDNQSQEDLEASSRAQSSKFMLN